MAKTAVALRLAPEVLEWADGYAAQRGVSRQVVLESAVASFMEDCKAGVPELRARARAQSAVRASDGVGECPRSPEGHVFVTRQDGPRVCEHCGLPGTAYLAEHGAARAEFFSRLRPAMTSGAKAAAR